uniref:Ribosomal protein S21 n=1 Tax=Ditylenchus dipsaci TaxID=166011 RepID=A0A915E7N7_9BILA
MGKFLQPFAVKLKKNIWALHPRWQNKTIMVKDNDVDGAFQLLNKLMEREGLLKIVRDTQFFIKPTQQRQNLSREASRAIVDEDMNFKMRFLARKNRVDAYPGQMTH